VEKETIKKVIF